MELTSCNREANSRNNVRRAPNFSLSCTPWASLLGTTSQLDTEIQVKNNFYSFPVIFRATRQGPVVLKYAFLSILMYLNELARRN